MSARERAAGVFRFLLGAAGLPLAWGLTAAFADLMRAPATGAAAFDGATVSLFAGMLVFLALWSFLPKPVRLYVLGHELTHALFGLLSGARVSNLRVGVTGGSVTLSKSNVWITLAPYFFPFWTAAVGAAALATRLFVSPLPWPCAWTFAVGFTWCFHVCFTIRSLLQTQPDVQEYGRLFSYVLIWICNILCVAAWTVCTTETPWRTAGERAAVRTAAAYGAVGAAARAGARAIARAGGI